MSSVNECSRAASGACELWRQTLRLIEISSRWAALQALVKTGFFFAAAGGLLIYRADMQDAAVFLDRDGTIIEERDYLHRPEEVVILPGVAPALKRLGHAGFKLFLVTNQSGVGRGYFTLDDVRAVHEHLSSELARAGVSFEKIYVAPEHPDAPSRGRKPSPQFLFDARDEFGVALERSFIIGDKLIDLECGWNAGVRKSILVRTGYGARAEREQPEIARRALIVEALPQAVDAILSGVV